MTYPLVEDLAVDGIPVAVTCRVLGFSKQAYYAWKAAPVGRRDLDNACLINAALDIHRDDPEFGYRFIADELAAHDITEGLPLRDQGRILRPDRRLLHRLTDDRISGSVRAA
jgi:putative transposase